jgi:hypothetical protein
VTIVSGWGVGDTGRVTGEVWMRPDDGWMCPEGARVEAPVLHGEEDIADERRRGLACFGVPVVLARAACSRDASDVLVSGSVRIRACADPVACPVAEVEVDALEDGPCEPEWRVLLDETADEDVKDRDDVRVAGVDDGTGTERGMGNGRCLRSIPYFQVSHFSSFGTRCSTRCICVESIAPTRLQRAFVRAAESSPQPR